MCVRSWRRTPCDWFPLPTPERGSPRTPWTRRALRVSHRVGGGEMGRPRPLPRPTPSLRVLTSGVVDGWVPPRP